MNFKEQHIDELLHACKKQDQKAQMELYQRYHKNTYHAAYGILKNRDDAMDRHARGLHHRLSTFGSVQLAVGSFGGWLRKIAMYGRASQTYHQNKKLNPRRSIGKQARDE